MTAPAVNAEGQWKQRPLIGQEYVSPSGERVIVAATWHGGAVLNNERVLSAAEFCSSYGLQR